MQEKLFILILIIATSLTIRQVVYLTGQQWINTRTHTTTLLLLPIITYAITSVISGNIALSLGMVGALSIIRFRNPVKSPFELVIYFLMITLGIAASVNYKWVIFLTGASISVLIFIQLVNYASLVFRKKPLFLASFNEGNSLHTLEVTASENIDSLANSSYLVSYMSDENGYTYRLAHCHKNKLTSYIRELEANKAVKNIIYNNA